MTHDELTELWREAGEPTLAGLLLRDDDLGDSYVVIPSDDGPLAGEYPDWSNPMTEFAMMCAAEQAAVCPLDWSDEGITGWMACDRRCQMLGPVVAPTRIECALRVIIECRKAEAASKDG